MLIKMDTDSVRGMSSGIRQTADSMDARLASISQVVTSAGWQSQAREEFMIHLETVRRSTTESVNVLRVMAQAADEKASQWEAIGNVFNGPFYSLRKIWGSVLNFIHGLWGGIRGVNHLLPVPSLPNFVFPAIAGFAIAGWFNKITPGWYLNRPDWWPANKNGSLEMGGVLGQQTKRSDLSQNLSQVELSHEDIYALFDEKQAAQLRLNEIQEMNLLSREKIAVKISELDDQIAYVEEQMRLAQEEAKNLFNKIVRNDGKSLSEIYRDIAEDYQRQIDELKDLKGKYIEQLNLHNESDTLKSTIIRADQLIDQKLPQFDGIHYAPGTDVTHWKQANPPFNNDAAHRDSRFYNEVIDQFGVSTNPRYTQDKYTYCNVFAADVARSMDVPFPTKSEFGVKPNDPMTIASPDLWKYFTKDSSPIKASQDGWREIGMGNLESLENHVNSGKMAIVISEGHVAVVRPNQNITDFKSMQIAQAGGLNSNSTNVGAAFATPLRNKEEVKIFIVD